MQAGHHPIKPCPAYIVKLRQEIPAPDGWELLLDQADHPVVVATTTVDDAEAVALTVMEQVEVVTYEFHLEQGLVDGHRPGRVHLLAQDQRTVALHLDGDEAAVGFGPAIAVHGGGDLHRRGGRRQWCGRRDWLHDLQHARHPHGDVVAVLDLAPVSRPAEPGLEFREGEVERGVPVVRGRLGPDGGTTGPYRQLDAFTTIRLPRVALLGDLHVDPYRLLVKLLQPG